MLDIENIDELKSELAKIQLKSLHDWLREQAELDVINPIAVSIAIKATLDVLKLTGQENGS